MRFFIKIDVLETIHGEYDAVARKAIGEQLQKLAISGKMENGGAFGDTRGGYMVLKEACRDNRDVTTANEIQTTPPSLRTEINCSTGARIPT